LHGELGVGEELKRLVRFLRWGNDGFSLRVGEVQLVEGSLAGVGRVFDRIVRGFCASLTDTWAKAAPLIKRLIAAVERARIRDTHWTAEGLQVFIGISSFSNLHHRHENRSPGRQQNVSDGVGNGITQGGTVLRPHPEPHVKQP